MTSNDNQLVVVVDTETTGFGPHGRIPRDDGIVQVGYAWRNNLGKVIPWYKTCNPGEKFLANGRADGALRVNGLSLNDILESPSSKEVSKELLEHLERIGSLAGCEVEIQSYNRRFDQWFLQQIPWTLKTSWGPCIMIDAVNHLDGPNASYVKLSDAVNRLGIKWPPGVAHNAAVDSHAALLVREALGKHMDGLLAESM